MRQGGKRSIPLVIFTPNSEQIVQASHDSHFAKILNEADITLPDGIGIIWAFRFIHGPKSFGNSSGISERIPGREFMYDLCGQCAKEGVQIGLIGGTGDIAVKALECLKTQFPRLLGWAESQHEMRVVGSQPRVRLGSIESRRVDERQRVEAGRLSVVGWEGREDDYFIALAQRIQKTHTGVIFVGLGAPKQEYVIRALARALAGIHASPVLMAVGGTFDVLSRTLPPVPKWISRRGFEWLWRLLLEPKRIVRQIRLIVFVLLAIKEKYFHTRKEVNG
ncbi:MAG: WecB/TagA/CpsF family glycosyltransferase [bacterium]|nr:WecB/TagA/CpsF family glycosyltransferase [bacterium]